MTNWNAGYVAEIDYTYGYFRELAPGLLSLAALSKGVAVNTGRPLRYLELGYGQGVALAVHAAACEGEFWGTDFHPGQASHARELARTFGAGEHLYDQSFAEFAARDDLPEFDVITLHGIWTWISPENRATIVDLVRRKLACGGMLYVSYNCMPGCAPLQPLQHLMHLHESLAGKPDKSITGRVQDALDFTQKVIATQAHYFMLNPIVPPRFQVIASQAPGYLAHEYFNRYWELMAFSQVSEMLVEAKLDFVGSANLLDHVDALNLSPEWLAFLADIEQPVLRESIRDYMLNTQFRKDLFVKGGRPMHALQREEAFLSTVFLLATPPADVALSISGLMGELQLDRTLFQPLLGALAEQLHAPKPLHQLIAAAGLDKLPLSEIITALVLLNGQGHVHPAQTPAQIASAIQRTRLLNSEILERARFTNDINFLASPVVGAGVQTRRIELLFLLARERGMPSAAWARFVFDTLMASGTRVMQNGAFLESEDDSMAELASQESTFSERRLPILQALGIALPVPDTPG